MRTELGSTLLGAKTIDETAVSGNGTTAGAIVNTDGYNSVSFINGVESFTDGVYTPLVNESDASNMSGETATADADLTFEGSSTTPEANAALSAAGVAIIDYIGIKQYVTCDVVATGVTTGATVWQVAILGKPRTAPVTA